MTGCRLFEVNDGVWSQVENQVRYQLGDQLGDLVWRWRGLDVQGHVE